METKTEHGTIDNNYDRTSLAQSKTVVLLGENKDHISGSDPVPDGLALRPT